MAKYKHNTKQTLSLVENKRGTQFKFNIIPDSTQARENDEQKKTKSRNPMPKET